jgi:hypothetical protein
MNHRRPRAPQVTESKVRILRADLADHKRSMEEATIDKAQVCVTLVDEARSGLFRVSDDTRDALN